MYSITGNDTIKINDRVLTDFADAEIGAITFPNNLVEIKTGKNGNSLAAINWTGDNAEMTLRILRGSPDDKYLTSLLGKMKEDFPAFNLLTGEFVKRIGDGSGNVVNDVYVLAGGAFTKNPEVKANVEGDTEQAVTIYTFKFAKAARVIG